MRNIDKLKSWLKEEAVQIRKLKIATKNAQREGKREASSLQCRLHYKRQDYRHHHIAYCELLGRTRDQIEPYYRPENPPNEHQIRKIKEEYAWSPEEIEAYKERQERRELAANAA